MDFGFFHGARSTHASKNDRHQISAYVVLSLRPQTNPQLNDLDLQVSQIATASRLQVKARHLSQRSQASLSPRKTRWALTRSPLKTRRGFASAGVAPAGMMFALASPERFIVCPHLERRQHFTPKVGIGPSSASIQERGSHTLRQVSAP